MRGLRAFLILAMLTAVETPQAWGPVGHKSVAYIAEDALSPMAKEKIARILGPGVELADVANWADSVREYRPYTASWHFIDLNVRQALSKNEESLFCPMGNCVVDQISKDIALLRERAQSPEAKQEALKFLIHFVGDVHQPLHCADDNDRGGNEKIVRYLNPGREWGREGWGRGDRGRKMRLHALWDRLIEVHTEEKPRALASSLERDITPAERKTWASGTAADWAWESYGIAKADIYPAFSEGPSDPRGAPLPDGYYSGKMRNIMNLQLEKAGIRLAYVLENIFGS